MSGMDHGIMPGAACMGLIRGIGNTNAFYLKRQCILQGAHLMPGVILRIVDPDNHFMRQKTVLSGKRHKAGHNMVGLITGRNGDNT
ncbi:hypothetical protein AA0312_0134 [Acetobacter tropicalis NRIC 0312]|nr:hypothetical protein ATR1_075c0158 [Acetobacter tropicalis]GBR66856.1 hypothetical protein AA0312_0134 [Acetobacter tropicalis NRIC 0312]